MVAFHRIFYLLRTCDLGAEKTGNSGFTIGVAYFYHYVLKDRFGKTPIVPIMIEAIPLIVVWERYESLSN